MNSLERGLRLSTPWEVRAKSVGVESPKHEDTRSTKVFPLGYKQFYSPKMSHLSPSCKKLGTLKAEMLQ